MTKLKYAILLALLFTFGAIPAGASTVATTTVLTIAPGAAVNAGTAVILTATVTDIVPNPVPRGRVLFCDATAAHCTNGALFGTAELNIGGTASLKLIL